MPREQNYLDSKDGVLEDKFRFVNNAVEDNLSQFFGGATSSLNNSAVAPPRDFKVVKPRPGFCVKTFKVNDNEKYFVNVCQTEEIPAPEEISEVQLSEILSSEEPSAYRIPMSISEPRITKDKSDKPVDVCDIAINPKFFAKLENKILFRDFFLTLIAEALSDKYNVQVMVEKSIILKNRKVMGTLVSHRVRNTDVKTVLNSYKNPSDEDKRLLNLISGERRIEEITPLPLDKNKVRKSPDEVKKMISQASCTEPEYKLRVKLRGEQVEELQAEFYLPKCITVGEMYLDIGEDRILLESMKHGYLFDKFVNYTLQQERAKAIFDKTNKMLQVRVPVLPVK